VEVNKPENSRNFGQPLRAFIDDVLWKYSIDRSLQHGGKLKGNQCRKLLTKSSVILMEIQEYVCSRPPECRIVGTNADIEEVFHWHHVLLVALDGLFSGLRTTRYKVNDKILDETVKFRDRVLQISRTLVSSSSVLFSLSSICFFLSHFLSSLSLMNYIKAEHYTKTTCYQRPCHSFYDTVFRIRRSGRRLWGTSTSNGE
jgi:hypothetical protein